MIEAKHRKWADLVFERYIKNLLRKHFYSFHLMGGMPVINESLPLIVNPNHSTWWDGFFVYLLNKLIFKRKFYILMLESRLEEYPFFAKLGAYSIDQNSPKKIAETINYSAGLLRNTKNIMLNFFPQGQLVPNRMRPLEYRAGLNKIIEKYGSEVNLLPLAMRIEYLEEQRGQVFFKFGKNSIASPENLPDMNQKASEMEQLLLSIDEDIFNGNSGDIILSGKRSAGDSSGQRKERP